MVAQLHEADWDVGVTKWEKCLLLVLIKGYTKKNIELKGHEDNT